MVRRGGSGGWGTGRDGNLSASRCGRRSGDFSKIGKVGMSWGEWLGWWIGSMCESTVWGGVVFVNIKVIAV